MPEIQHLPSGTDKHIISARLKQDGALILDDVINPEFIKALRAETDPYMDATRTTLLEGSQPAQAVC
jgi:hypothetical protein